MWKQVRSVHERSLVTGALIHAYLPSAGRAVGGSGKALSPRSPALMTVFMLTHTGRVPSFQLLITFGHRRRPEISLPLYHFFTSLQKSSRGRRYELPSPGQAAAASSRHIFPPPPVVHTSGCRDLMGIPPPARPQHTCSYHLHQRLQRSRSLRSQRSRFNGLALPREGSQGSRAVCRNKTAEVG